MFYVILFQDTPRVMLDWQWVKCMAMIFLKLRYQDLRPWTYRLKTCVNWNPCWPNGLKMLTIPWPVTACTVIVCLAQPIAWGEGERNEPPLKQLFELQWNELLHRIQSQHLKRSLMWPTAWTWRKKWSEFGFVTGKLNFFQFGGTGHSDCFPNGVNYQSNSLSKRISHLHCWSRRQKEKRINPPALSSGPSSPTDGTASPPPFTSSPSRLFNSSHPAAGVSPPTSITPFSGSPGKTDVIKMILLLRLSLQFQLHQECPRIRCHL